MATIKNDSSSIVIVDNDKLPPFGKPTSTYCADLYNSIGTISQSYITFRSRDGFHFLSDVLKPLLGNQHLEKQFGFGFLHRHFDLQDGEKLVEFNSSASKWTEVEMLGGKVVGDAWMIVGESFVPYEFRFVPFGKAVAEIDFKNDAEMCKFESRFINAVKCQFLESAVCLHRSPGKDNEGGMELTAGQTNIMLKMDQIPEDSYANSIATQWFFDHYLKGIEWRCQHKPDPSTN